MNIDNKQSVIYAEIYNRFDRLQNIQQQWDNLVESLGNDIFMTYDWCRIWWKHYGHNRSLRVFVFRNNDELVGIIPLFFEKIWVGPIFIRVAKIVGSDFIPSQFSLTLALGHEKAVANKFYELISDKNLDIIHLGPISGVNNNFEELQDIFKQSSNNTFSVLTENKNVQTYFPLADDWESYLGNLSKRDRGDIRRNYRYINKSIQDESAIIKSSFVKVDELEKEFDEFVEMHQAHWKKLGRPGHFDDWPKSREFHLKAAKSQLQQGRLQLLKVMIKDICLGYEYTYKLGNTCFEFLNARADSEELKNISVGKIVFSELVKKSIEQNIKFIDSMRGKYEHKLRLGGKLFSINSMYLIRKNNAFSTLRIGFFRYFSKLLNLCYYRIWYCRIAPKLPLKQKPLWKIWMRTNVFA